MEFERWNREIFDAFRRVPWEPVPGISGETELKVRVVIPGKNDEVTSAVKTMLPGELGSRGTISRSTASPWDVQDAGQ